MSGAPRCRLCGGPLESDDFGETPKAVLRCLKCGAGNRQGIRRDRNQTRQPMEITSDLIEVRTMLPKLRRGYALAHDFAYSPGGMPGAESGRGDVVSFSDSTGDAAVSAAKRHARRRIGSAGRMIDQALSLLRAASDAVEAEAWPKDRDGYTPVEVFAPSLLTRAELKDSKAAQVRRISRDER